MKTPSDIIEYVGRERVMARFGITKDAIVQAIRRGALPASWYDGLEAMAGRPLDRSLFSFKKPEAGE